MRCAVCGYTSEEVVCWRCLPAAPSLSVTEDLISDQILPSDLMWVEPTPVQEPGAPESERKVA